MLGFDTIGSATVIAYDGEPILTTDAWITDSAYFGSWGHDFEIPAEQMAAIRGARYHWFSHGHPDHLNNDSLPLLTGGRILLADHYGSRIAKDLAAIGHQSEVLRDWEWRQLSPNIRVCTIANQNQDSLLLIDINGRLIINANDSPQFGEAWRIRRLAKQFKEVYLLQLHGWGGADMLNFFDSGGNPLTRIENKRRPIAPRAQREAMAYGATRVIPFSSFHRFQRTDSAWANQLVPTLDDYHAHATPNAPQMLPAFVRVDCENDSVTPINPTQLPLHLKTPEEVNDRWSDPLTAEDKARIAAYFKARPAIAKHYGFLEVTAGGSTVTVDLNPARRAHGISFEAPRNSLMACINDEIFDDMLIGNYMKTTLHGDIDGLYPNFTPWIGKYADNGRAMTEKELGAYFSHYFLRDPIARIVDRFSTSSEMVLRRMLPEDGAMFRAAKKLYYAAAARKSSAR